MKQGSTLILRGTVLLIGLIVLALCVIVLPFGLSLDKIGGYRPILLGLDVPAVPFYVALYQAWKLLGFIDKNKAFSDSSVRVLQKIKYCAVTISALFAAGMPYLYYMAQKDDAPGVVLLGLVIAFASFVIATFAAVLQKLIQNGLDIQSENDLTV